MKLFDRLFDKAKQSERIYIVPSKNGFLFIGVNFTLFLMGLVYANNLALLLAFSLFATLLLIMFQTHAIMEKFDYKGITLSNDYADESPGIYLKNIADEIRVSLLSDNDELETNRIGEKFVIKNPKRGKYKIGHMKVHTRGSSDFFYVWTYRKVDRNLYIYPKKIQCPWPSLNSNDKTKAGSGEFDKHFPYSDSDSAKRIDWKAYARSNSLLVKEYEEESSEGILIDENQFLEDREKALSKMAWLVDQSLRKGQQWGLKTKTANLSLDKGHAHWQQSMELLSEA